MVVVRRDVVVVVVVVVVVEVEDVVVVVEVVVGLSFGGAGSVTGREGDSGATGMRESTGGSVISSQRSVQWRPS